MEMRRLASWPSSLLLSVFLIVIILSASASVYEFSIVETSSIVQNPSLTLQTGDTGSSSISLGSSANSGITAGLFLYENNSPSTNSVPTSNLGFVEPSAVNHHTFASGQNVYLYSPQYPVTTQLYAGLWTLTIYLSSSSPTKANIAVEVEVVNQSGYLLASLLNSTTTQTLGKSPQPFSLSLNIPSYSIPVGSYIAVAMQISTANGKSVTISWGGQYPSLLRTNSVYNYILKLSNPTTLSWNINLGLISVSNQARLSNVTIWFNSTSVSKQISIGSAINPQLAEGPVITLAPSSTVYIAVNATATSFGSSTLILSLVLQRQPSGPTSTYGISLNVG